MSHHHTTPNVLVLEDAARVARVEFDRFNRHGSRSRDHAFDVTLTGNSRRRPNNNRGGDAHAATWDQWGVFLAVLFDRDPIMVTPYYADQDAFDRRTFDRFANAMRNFWPTDAHGDHKFEFHAPFVQKCRHCSARQTWKD